MFVNLFISRWRHPNAEIRINAVTKLNPSKPSDAEKLWQLAMHDPDQDVRVAAILCLDDKSKLFELITNSEDDVVINAVSSRIDQLYDTQSLSLNQLEELDTPAITRLLCASTNATIHDHFVMAVKAQSQLAQLAMHAALASTRQIAAKQLDEEPLISKVYIYAKIHDKAVYRIIRDQQKLKQQQLIEQQEALCHCDELIQQLNDLVKAQDDRHIKIRFEYLIQQWQSHGRLATDAQKSTFSQLQQQIEQQLKDLQAKTVAEAEKRAQQQQLSEDIHAIKESISHLINSHSSVTPEHLEQHHKQLALITQQSLSSSQQQACDQLSQILNCLTTILERADAFRLLDEVIEKTVSIEQLDSGIEQAKLLCQVFENWPSEFTPHPLSMLLNERIKTLQHERQRLREQLKAVAEKEQQQQQSVLKEKELLCVAMEALIDLDIPANEKAQHIRALQQQWKDLDQKVSVSVKSLWDRFHKASKQAYAPCEQHFREQSRIRAWNLSQREQICQLIESYYESLDWSNPDWSAIEMILKKAKTEWREFSPVDRAPGKPLQERFNALIERADNALNGYRQECANAKQAIVEEASKLAASEESEFAAATHRFKELQSEWKQIDSAEHKRERQLWKAFREQGDLLFSRLRAHQQHQRSQEELAARLLCVRLEILLNQPSPESDQYLRMEYQMERLEEALETPSAEEQSIELTNLVNQWQEEGYGEHYPDLDERFHQLLDQH
ncbi:MAG: DUF349 domain-containing protein [Oceanospirillales bacterium]|nr:MAG: DUF349 domain-containing protein [Oceanospirillales bacterium]